jgi:hypothetical protein
MAYNTRLRHVKSWWMQLWIRDLEQAEFSEQKDKP